MVVHAGICTAVAVFFHIVVRYGSPILIWIPLFLRLITSVLSVILFGRGL
jgi:hypothetical protein